MTKRKKRTTDAIISLIMIIVILFFIVILTSCRSRTGITIIQRTKCIYNSGSVAIFEYSRVENYRKVITEYRLDGSCKEYEVGRYYNVVVRK